MSSPRIDHRAAPSRQGEQHWRRLCRPASREMFPRQAATTKLGKIRRPQMGRIHRPLRPQSSSELRTVTALPALCLNVFGDQLPATAVEIARHRFPLCLHTEATAALLVSAHTQIGDEFSLSHAPTARCSQIHFVNSGN